MTSPAVNVPADRHEAAGRLLAPWHAGRQYPNFAERRTDPSDFYPAETIGRLRRIKAAQDPGDLIRSNQPVNRQP